MSFLPQLKSKIHDSNELLHINGVNASQWFFIQRYLHEQKLSGVNVYVFENDKQALEFSSDDENGHHYPDLNHSPYSSVISSEYDFSKRLKTLKELYKNKNEQPLNIYCSYTALFLNNLDSGFFNSQDDFKIKQDDIISPQQLSEKLVELGYQFSSQIQESGDFSKRGEIFDIYTFEGRAVRLHYFDDLIEEIFNIDLETQRTLKDEKIQEVIVGKSNQVFSQEKYSKVFRENFPRPELKYNNLVEIRENILKDLSHGNLFANYSLYAPLFTHKPMSLLEHLKEFHTDITIFNKDQCEVSGTVLWDNLQEQYRDNLEDLETTTPLIEPSVFYSFEKIETHQVNELAINLFEDELSKHINLNIISSLGLYKGEKKYLTFPEPKSRFQYLKNVSELLLNNFEYQGHIFLLFKYTFSQDEMIKNLKEYGVSHQILERVHIISDFQCDGFYYEAENLIVISESDWGAKKKKTTKTTPKSRSADFFAEQISNLKIDDYVIHAEFGVGQYKGLESIQYGESASDFLVIHYADNDKVYVPVYKINLVQKHTDSSAESKLDSLRSKKFQQAKDKARKAAKALAFDLIELQAKRKLEKGYAYSESGEEYKSFEIDFPYDETPDQEKAISKVIGDMESENPMDRLVCGDVGFGKTEVAMRAAFKAIVDNKQVAVLVPTTILTLQHFNSFKQRFKNFPVNIDFLSRLKTPKQSKEIIQKVNDGQIDIIIGTHKLLSNEVQYKDLGLVIIDEEHRFGVAHKEKLKQLKASVDILTLTATPIPRTMQLAQLGLRDISIIQTPPPKRQSVKTFLIREDVATIKEAMERELKRGGQIYYIHNRVNDIEIIAHKIRQMVPKAKIVIAHGQMSERELEKRIQKFYDGDAQILLATTIVESGLDIPSANTMIINRADRFGLAQLHQLRGRIGRSDRKAYAYLVLPQNRKVGDIASKRLKAMQTFSEMGAGFSIASSDLDIRGAGNILGGEQSGHISSIGLELYLELLQEAVQELKGSKDISIQNIEIQTHFPAFIPANDIKDHGQRLRYYKRMSRCQNIEALKDVKDEILDLYGQLSEETQNLYSVFETRLMASKLYLMSIKTSKHKIILKFDQKLLEDKPEARNKLIDFFLSRPNTFKLKPDFSVICSIKESVDRHVLTHFVTSVAEQI